MSTNDKLEYIANKRDQANQNVSEAQARHNEAVLAKVYEMSKDRTLVLLQRAMEKAYVEAFEKLHVTQKARLEAIVAFNKATEKVKAYVATPSFRKRLAEKLAKVSVADAEHYFNNPQNI
jgi:vacuolar-type H+-ATPase subunit E/Vma4